MSTTSSQFLSACSSGNLEELKRLLDQNSNYKRKRSEFPEYLKAACENGHLAMVKYFIIDLCQAPPPTTEEFPHHVQQFLGMCNGQFLEKQRAQIAFEMRQFIHLSGLRDEWDSLKKPPFHQNVPLHITHMYQFVEKQPTRLTDLKIYLKDSKMQSHVIYVEKERLAASCPFMHNLLMGDMNDLQQDEQDEGMQKMELVQEFLRGCPTKWLKWLIVFLSLHEEGDQLQHSVNEKGQLRFKRIVQALMYCKACQAMGLKFDLSSWIDQIKEFVEKFNDQWIQRHLQGESNPNGKTNLKQDKYCISEIPSQFEMEMLDAWTHILGTNNASVYFFLLVNSLELTNEETDGNKSLIGHKCLKWLQQQNETQEGAKYKDALKNCTMVDMLKGL